jgi:small subunit ribosomal protein S2
VTDSNATVTAAVPQPAESVTVTDLLNAGVHFGHQSKRWNPKMRRFIFEKRSGIYIIDLTKSLAQLEIARQFLSDTVTGGKSILFVGTKRQSHEIVKEAAIRCGQHYVVTRWLGGTLTNYQNIANSIQHMKDIQALEQKGALETMPQKEASRLRHELERLQRNLSGIAEMHAMPGAMVVVDINREAIAVREAKRAGIPVVAMVDTNSDPDPIDYPIPANDDSTRSIRIIINILAETIARARAEYATISASQAAEKPAETKAEVAAAKTAVKSARGRRPRRGMGIKSKLTWKKEEKAPRQKVNAETLQPAVSSSN